MSELSFSDYVKFLKPICEGLHRTFAGRIEFILHDLSMPESSVVLVIGDLTHRQIGAPATNLLLKVLSCEGDDAKDIIGYPSMSKDGRILKSSTIFLRNGCGKIIGCFCCNVDLTDFNTLAVILSNITSTVHSPYQGSQNTTKYNEIFAQRIDDVVSDIIRYEISNVGMPVSSMSRNNKVELICSLDRRGVFNVKGTPEMLAEIFDSTIFTIYNYIKEVRNNNKCKEQKNDYK